MIPRPQVHFTPPRNFMNDPNGLVFYAGEYHLFYQHNPFGESWGHMSWGHAISHDLVKWEHLPVALFEEDGIMIFSGSAVMDWGNTSGLGSDCEPPMIAIYTGHTSEKQTQNLAHSTDRGRTWTKYPGNPLLDIGSSEFRDPKVFWHAPTARWIMLTVLADQHKVRFDASPDLLQWSYLSEFGPAGAVDGLWECPDLFPLPVADQPGMIRWVLKVDVQYSIGAQYFVGEFDGTRFINPSPDSTVLRVDYGKDFYAAQSWSDTPDGRRIWIGWLNNWTYAKVIPTSPWQGLFSVPRQLSLYEKGEGIFLVQQPILELASLRQLVYQAAGSIATPTDIAVLNAQIARLRLGRALEIKAEFALHTASEFGLKILDTVIGYDVRSEQVFIDRRRSGKSDFSPAFAGLHRAPLPPEQGKIYFHIFVDTCSVEAFLNHGRVVISDLIFPLAQDTSIEIYSQDGKVLLLALDIWNLKGK
jgi:fructan beta-fructosidase